MSPFGALRSLALTAERCHNLWLTAEGTRTGARSKAGESQVFIGSVAVDDVRGANGPTLCTAASLATVACESQGGGGVDARASGRGGSRLELGVCTYLL